MGDFNDILLFREKNGGSDKSVSGMLNFRETLEAYGLEDLAANGPQFTWNNKRKDQANIQKRLDLFLANEDWRELFDEAWVENLDFWFSDHRPVLISLESKKDGFLANKEKGFKFEP
ncbi:hypothetical protein ACOSQ3_018768 [Xanthoceras sorbifolium]